ncbi:MAG: LuxR C-terminal-related transcriptional regulator, partial [Chloroflexi bacterium]|nr:LuxR C-terminal-related transcriptional regulator [Chloroflexota bacterium]
WIADSTAADWQFCWLSLDQGDNDPARFWTYVIAALQHGQADIGQDAQAMLQAPLPQRPPIETVLTSLINEAATCPGTLILVLDDVHLITAPEVHDALTLLVDRLPPSLYVVLSSRADPPWPLARLRARGAIVELRTEDLRFTPAEAATFLNDVMRLGLAAGDVAALEDRTEGWIVGLQMAALSMQGRDDAAAFVRSFSGDHRFILDYLVEEVLERQPGDIQGFLLDTSILERMTAPLCDAVTGREDSRAILAHLERANLFLVALDDERCWYRYHHLFADLLRSRLEWSQPDRGPVLHRQAAEWYEQHGFMEDAVRHALQAQDFGLASRLITRTAFSLWARSDVLQPLSWMQALPRDQIYSQPVLCINLAWAFANIGQFDAIEQFLQPIERYLQAAGLSPEVFWPADRREHHAQPTALDERQLIEGRDLFIWMDVLRAFAARFQGSPNDAIALGERALARMPADNPRMRGQALFVLGHAHLLAGHAELAESTMRDAIQVNRAVGVGSAYLSMVYYLAELRVLQGRLGQAEALYREALQFVADQERPSLAGIEHIGLGDLWRERNDLDAAARHIQEGLRLAEQGGDFAFLLNGYIARARLEQAVGHWAEARADIQQADQIARRSPASRNVALVAAWQARLGIAQGDLAAVARWVDTCGLHAGDALDFLSEFGHLTLARAFLALGRPAEAGHLLARLLPAAESAGRAGRAIEIRILQARAWQAQGQAGPALAALEPALLRAEPEGYVRTFIDEGAPLVALLRLAATRGIAPGYVGRLLAALEAETRDGEQRPALVEPLSERELEVLRLLPTSLSTPEMAHTLVISTYTVRSHVKSIYGKLNVHRRMDAISRAKELGLL